MTDVNEKNGKITIEMSGNSLTLESCQMALIDLLKNFRREESPAPNETSDFAFHLLEALTMKPEKKDMKKVYEVDTTTDNTCTLQTLKPEIDGAKQPDEVGILLKEGNKELLAGMTKEEALQLSTAIKEIVK